MSTFRTVSYKCGLCGHTFDARKLMSTNSFGSPDLDFRVSGMMRRTMGQWVYRCPRCGYTHARIQNDGKKHMAYIKTKEYLLCEGVKLLSPLACNFYRYGLILLRDNETVEAYEAFLHAAWVCDDSLDPKGAYLCRKRAISLYDNALFKGSVGLTVRHIDLLRRTGEFEKALKLCAELESESESVVRILELQKQLSEAKDTGGYQIPDAEKQEEV